MEKVLIVMLSHHLPKRSIEAAVAAADKEGELFFLRIFPVVVTQGFGDIEEHSEEAKQKRNTEARNMLEQCIEYARNEWRGENPKIFSLMREGEVVSVASSFAEFTKPDLIILPEKDSHKLGSFASGDLVASLRKKTGIPLRVVG